MASNEPPPKGGLPRGILGRRGTPVGKDTRLPSLRGPRDLTLGGVKKKTFQPTIPARRVIKEDTTYDAGRPKSGSSGRADRGRRGDRGRERGRGRGRGDVIQSHSIFEEGPTDVMRKRDNYQGDSLDRTSVYGARSSTGVKREKQSTEDTKKILDNLMRDDFVSDGRLDGEDPSMAPVCLPIKKEVKLEIKPTKEQIKVKEEPEDGSDVTKDESDMKMVEDKPDTDSIPGRPTKDPSYSQPKSAGQLFSNAAKSEEGELLLFQLPDTLPGEPEDDTDPRNRGREKVVKSGGMGTGIDKEAENELSARLGQCSLTDFSEGHIGKLQVLQSGKVRLVLGNTILDVTLGTSAGFLQDLVSVEMDGDNGDMSVLGHVQHKLLCLPDFEHMLGDR